MPLFGRKRQLPRDPAVVSLKRRMTRLEQGTNRELKTYDDEHNATMTSTWTIFAISDMAQGDTSITRDGLQIQPRHLSYKLRTSQGESDTDKDVHSRVVIFQDREQHGTTPTAAEVFEGATPDSYAFPEHDTRPRFKILRDINFVYNTNGQNNFYKQGIIKFAKNSRIWYEGTTGSEASLGKNNIFVAYITNQATAPPGCNHRYRLRFVDI